MMSAPRRAVWLAIGPANAACQGVSVSLAGQCLHITAVHLPGYNGQIAGANDSGTVVGSYSTIPDFIHPGLGFYQPKNGPVSTFSEPNAVSPTVTVPPLSLTQPLAINNAGRIVGYYNDTKGMLRGFVLSGPGGTFTTFDYFMPTVSGNGTVLRAINQAGDMAGRTYGMPGGDAGFLIVGSNKTSFVYQNLDTNPLGVNNFGEVVGTGGTSPVVGFYRAPGGAMSGINYPNAKSTTARVINDVGYVGGTYVDGSSTPRAHGFVYDRLHNQYYGFDIPGSISTNVSYLNNAFEIWGNYATSGGGSFWYHLVPSGFDTPKAAH